MTNPAKLTEQERAALLDTVQVKPDPDAGKLIDGAKVPADAVLPDPWSDEEKDHFVAKGWRTFRPGERPAVSVLARPTDYQHDLARGTVALFPGLRNYSVHSVEITPGSVLVEHNFAQLAPNTPAIICDGELTLIRCNLVNCRLDPRWRLENCNTAQAWLTTVTGPDGEPRDKRKYICAHPDQLKGDESPPANVLTERDF